MIILALDSSSKAASCALLSEDKLIGESYLDSGLTHSQTLMPMVRSLCDSARADLASIGGVAVSSGPGSFTGLRIGLSSAKALAAALRVPCAGVSTLFSLACNLRGFEGVCCAALDARRSEVYYALFSLRGGAVRRLCADSAAPLEALPAALEGTRGTVFLAGDGARLCLNGLSGTPLGDRLALAPPHLRLQRASGVGFAAQGLAPDAWMDAADLRPSYLRQSQAERERRERRAGQASNHENQEVPS